MLHFLKIFNIKKIVFEGKLIILQQTIFIKLRQRNFTNFNVVFWFN